MQKCYVDSSRVPYFVVKSRDEIGNLYLVIRKKGKKVKKLSCAVAADVNTSIKYDKQGTEYGEGSLKLLQNLGKKDKSNTDYGYIRVSTREQHEARNMPVSSFYYDGKF